MSGIDSLARSPYFEGVAPESLHAILGAGRVVRLGPGEVVLRPGEHHRTLHFVLEGQVEVRLEATSGTVSRVEPGECFGEMAVIEGRPASAWVVAASACEILRVPEERVFSDLLPLPGFARGLLRLLSARLRLTLERQATWEQVRKELRLAREIQSSMLPRAGVLFPERPEVDCAATMDPATEVGGDFYDAFFLDERHLFFAVGDVAGKGVSAALFMARSVTILRAEALRRRPLHELLGRVNETSSTTRPRSSPSSAASSTAGAAPSAGGTGGPSRPTPSPAAAGAGCRCPAASWSAPCPGSPSSPPAGASPPGTRSSSSATGSPRPRAPPASSSAKPACAPSSKAPGAPPLPTSSIGSSAP